MRILVLSMSGDGMSIAQRMTDEGHDVRMFIKDAGYKKAGVGIIKRVVSWRPLLSKTDLVVCDMVGFGNYEGLFKKMGIPVISCNKLTDLMETDRKKGMDVFSKFGIDIPQTFNYDNPQEALDILNIWEGSGYVIKPSGNIETAKTYVCKDKDTYEWALSTYDAGQQMIIQAIVDGVEISTEGWFNGRDWIAPFNHTFEEKRFMDGGIGPQTGCQGNVVITTKGNKITKATVEKLTPFLKKVGYRGPVDVNAIVNDQGVFGLEISSRIGYDAIEALMEGLQESVTDLLFETAVGIKREMNISSQYLISVRASLPPWPHSGDILPDAEGRPITILDEEALKHIFFSDIYKDADGYKFAGSDGVLLKVTARGSDVREARRRVYRTIGNIKVLDMQYRSDIGERVDSDMAQLKSWGYI